MSQYLHEIKNKKTSFGPFAGTSPIFPNRCKKLISIEQSILDSRSGDLYEQFGEEMTEATGLSFVEPVAGASAGFLQTLIFLRDEKIETIFLELPYYEPYFSLIRHFGFKIKFINKPMKFTAPKRSAAVISNPHFFHGSMLNKSELEKVADSVSFLVLDEVHLPQFTRDHRFSLGLKNRNVISIGGFSKAVGLSSIRAGWIATRSRRIHEKIRRTSLYVHVDMPTLSLLTAIKVMQNRKVILDSIKNEFEDSSVRARELFQAPRLAKLVSHNFENGYFGSIRLDCRQFKQQFLSSSLFGKKGFWRFRIDKGLEALDLIQQAATQSGLV